jgi:DNA-binding transcriptional LysR family regulator
MAVDLTQLRSFAAIAHVGQLTRAAETLHLSQPALSGQIKALEEDLGVTLFQRGPAGMTLTPSGQALLAEAEAVLAACARLVQRAQALRAQPTGRLQVGTVLDPALVRVGDLLALAMVQYPQIELDLHQVVSHDALAGVGRGSLDATFYFGPEPGPGFGALPLREVVYRVACPAAWAGELRGAAWPALAQRPWILAPEGSSHYGLVQELFHGREAPARTVEADHESVILNLVESGVGASIVREELALASALAGRSVIWPGGQVTTRLWLVWATGRDGDPLVDAVRTMVREVWTRPVAAGA